MGGKHSTQTLTNLLNYIPESEIITLKSPGWYSYTGPLRQRNYSQFPLLLCQRCQSRSPQLRPVIWCISLPLMAHAGCRASARLLESNSASLGYRERTLASIYLRSCCLTCLRLLATCLWEGWIPPSPINFTGVFTLMLSNAAVSVGVISLVV